MMMPSSRKRSQITVYILKTLFFFLVLGILYNNLWAFNIELEPDISWRLSYEDNTQITGHFSNRYIPNLNFKIEGQRLLITGHTGLTVYRYVSDEDKIFNQTDRDYDIQSTVRLSPRSETTFGASYSRDSDPLRYFTGEQGVESGVFVRQSQINITKNYTGSYLYKLTSQGTLKLLFNYANFSTSASSGSPVYSYNFSYDYILSNKDSINLSLGYSNLKFNYTIAEELINYELDSYNISSGLIHKFSETCKLSFTAGWNFSDTKSQQAVFKEDPETGEQVFAGTESITNSTSGSNFNLQFEKIYYHTTFVLTGAQFLYTDPETGRTYPTQNFGFTIRHDLTSKLSGSLGWSMYNNKTSAGDYNNRVDYEYEANYTTASLSYAYKPNITLSLGYSRANSKDKKPIKNEEIQNYAFLQCSFALQRPLILR
jgi:hypothetical protein